MSSPDVSAVFEPLSIPTYPVGEPEKNPVFFEKRVYQGSNGKVYPVPFIDKVGDIPQPTTYRSARLENEHLRLVLLPEIGGRIFLGQDKSNNDYDFFYRQDVIKPALVGLAGPWISGGVEFNWPQHHRPGTFLPCDVFIEEESGGVRTVWMSEHDPLNRLKGMHGIRLRPGSSLIELRGRLYNRTPLTQTFLWWANLAAMVHDDYESFFPADVNYVADHAVRALSSFPVARNDYYGIDYAAREGANNLCWYKNIPVPTSYMVCQTRFDFFGGYDHRAGGGFVHIADRHIAPGKKQWTWGNHPFGHAWDRELTDANGPYIELMAGVYTDNQPDFSYLLPYETKTFSQYWWPIQGLGPVQQATTDAALRLVVNPNRTIDFGVNVSSRQENLCVLLKEGDRTVLDLTITLAPGECWRAENLSLSGDSATALCAMLISASGEVLLEFRPVDTSVLRRDRQQATEPPAPEEVPSADELYFIAEHLEQYRHPTKSPELYWREALRRDPGDARCNLALGRDFLRRGMFAEAATHLDAAISRLTSRHPNPVTGEAHYYLGVCRQFQNRVDEAMAAFAKASWNSEWRSASNYHLACLAMRLENDHAAASHLKESLATNRNHQKASVLLAILHRHNGHSEEARQGISAVLATDPLDHFARAEEARQSGDWTTFLKLTRNDAQTMLDLVFDLSDAGLVDEAVEILEIHHAQPTASVAVPNPMERTPMTKYALAWLRRDQALLAEARAGSPDRFFPSRIHEQLVLEDALVQPGADPLAAYSLGNFFYDRKRYDKAIACWEQAVQENPDHAQAHRNLGLALWNVRRDGDGAAGCYTQAIECDPEDARLVSEFDQLCLKRNTPLATRLAFLERHLSLVLQRDDCTVSLATLYNLTGQPEKALALLTSRRFHPWEGGEGAVLRQYTTAKILIGREALKMGDAATALEHFTSAMETPETLGEAYHLLQAKADVNYWIGIALRALGRNLEAREHFELSAGEAGDFSNMAVTLHSPLSFYRGLSLRALGRENEAMEIFGALQDFAAGRLGEPATIDYFATSLPNLLVFDEDLKARRDAEAWLMIALANLGLGESDRAAEALAKVEAFSCAIPEARDIAAELSETTRQ